MNRISQFFKKIMPWARMERKKDAEIIRVPDNTPKKLFTEKKYRRKSRRSKASRIRRMWKNAETPKRGHHVYSPIKPFMYNGKALYSSAREERSRV